MTVCALLSAGGSPGVTTAALALALTWPGPMLVAETDPSGGDVLAGLFAGHVPGNRGLLNVAYEATTIEAAAAAVADQLVALDKDGTRSILPGLADPRHAATLNMTWHLLAGALAAQPVDVLADCGRLDGGPGQEHILRVAGHIVLVLRPTLRQAAAARPRVDMITQLKGTLAGQVSLLVTGPGPAAPKELSRALGVPLLGTLPDDRKAALVLSDGAAARRGIEASPLLRAAAATARALTRTYQAAPDVPASGTELAAVPGRA
ncbi:MAG: hypothetical protein ACRDOK_27375 [Streptosporangiaceae bacterium]